MTGLYDLLAPALSLMGIITLTTDFSLADTFVAQMKGAILSCVRETTIVDITHDIPKFDIVAGALALREAAPSFPDGTVHVGVVDPGVGSARARVVIAARYEYRPGEVKRAFFVGPDNGLLTLAAPPGCRTGCWTIDELERFGLGGASKTFEGRDIFAPVAALLSEGSAPSRFGVAKSDLVELALPMYREAEGRVEGEIISFDSFGNAATNIPAAGREGTLMIGEVSCEWNSTFSSVSPGSALAYANSRGFVEAAVNGGSLRERHQLRRGTPVLLIQK